MLGRLIQTAASYGKNNPALESATEEAHTRNLLYGQSQHAYALAQSPPSSPFAGPTFRPGSFDDRGGLELEEKDLRILIAQDAFGAEEKPSLLFDSSAAATAGHRAAAHTRHASTTQAGPRSPVLNDWRPGTPVSPKIPSGEIPSSSRHRSSTTSGVSNAWSRPAREAGTREDAFLECMFGVTSSTKATSTTKMHLMPGKSKMQGPSRSSTMSDAIEQPSRRAQLVRSRTSNMAPCSPQPSPSILDTETSSSDVVLITRLFSVNLPESVATTTKGPGEVASTELAESADGQSPSLVSPTSPSQQHKKPKLVERKVPAFAIGLVLYLPRIPDPRTSTNRPASRSAHAHTISSASSSYGSDMQGSWTFLNAIPESLASSKLYNEETDRRVEIIVNNWDVILRAIATLERQAAAIIFEQLEKTLNQVVGPAQKTPKEKSMQRINQRIISITDPAAVARRPALQKAARHLIGRVWYALRIPRVTTGLGFATGHWPDEARTLYRMCGRRQHNFFLFNLLTAFLGNHTQWLERLAPEWYRKQYRASHRKRPESHLLSQRTVIISDQRAIARRLVFILASFLPGLNGADGLQKAGEELLSAGHLSTSSPSSHLARNESLRRAANRRVRNHRLQSNANEAALLSTSASSTDSVAPFTKDVPRRYLARKDSDAVSIRHISNLPASDLESQSWKTGAGTTSMITPNPATPVAYFSTKNDSYFPEGVVAETKDSIASADLANILRRNSSNTRGDSSNVSSRWGSLISGISDLWSIKEPLSGPSSTSTQNLAYGSVGRRGTESSPSKVSKQANSPRGMVQDLDRNGPGKSNVSGIGHQSDNVFSRDPNSPTRQRSAAPQMKVDDRDGVVDVNLDLPGFSGLQMDGFFTSPTKRSHRPSVVSGFDGSESIRSLRNVPNASPRAPVIDEISVAGYLRRMHEDFTLHAARPYAELEDDIRRSMSTEVSPSLEYNGQIDTANLDGWTNVCTTLVADLRTFSLRRITLRRKVELHDDSSKDHATPSQAESTNSDKTSYRLSWAKAEGEFVEEEVKDFDTVLADAVERVLNLSETMQPSALRSPRLGHSRAASVSTTTTKPSPPGPSVADFNFVHISQDYARQDCRQVVMSALEEVAKDVNDDINKIQTGRDIQSARLPDVRAVKADVKRENVLREGVKRWLLNVEQTRVW